MEPIAMNKDQIKLDRWGRKEMRGHITGPLIIALFFFLAAGRLDLYRAWTWAILTLLYYLAGGLVLLRINPGLLNERGNWDRKKDTKAWDKIILWIFAGVGFYGHAVLMALDVGRFGWSRLGSWFILPGAILYTASFILVYWSMAVNENFETSVRIQYERDHKVADRGPYRIVRHPGYAGLIIGNFGSAMIVGSAYGLITASATLLILLVRTWMEDRTLMQELEGYQEYADSTPYRLIPFLW